MHLTSKITFLSATRSLGQNKAEAHAKTYAAGKGFIWTNGASVIFKASCDEQLAPSYGSRKVNSEQHAIEIWVDKYFNDYNNRPSRRVSNVPTTKHDKALDIIIQNRLKNLSDSDLDSIKWAHRLSMSAENIFGAILEEYLAERLEPHGWYCSWGAVTKAVDFVSNQGRFLQIKSRNNTENSSSNKIRNGTTIEKWWRFHATKGTTNWSELNNMLGISGLSESDFQQFVRELIVNNPNAMAVENGNTW